MTFNDLSSPARFLATRRSGKPRDMVAPGPDATTLDAMLATALRTPDHGKLAPWRFVVIDDRGAFEDLLLGAYRGEHPTAGSVELDAMRNLARQGMALVVALYSPRDSHIPEWEQELSCGAACMNFVAAAGAHGFVASWLTGWPAYATDVRDAFGSDRERIAGFIYIGSPGRALEERPRPDFADRVSHWP